MSQPISNDDFLNELRPQPTAGIGAEQGYTVEPTPVDLPPTAPIQNLDSEPAARPSDLVNDTFPDAPFIPGKIDADDIREIMKDVIDPELMINVVDLGLLYDVHLDDEGNVTLDMTLTSPTCPLTDRIEYDTQIALQGNVKSATINWVWIPAWNLSMITDDGREQLRAVGFAI